MKKAIDNLLLEPNGYYLQIKAWHRKSCSDNDCATALLAYLLFYHRIKQSMKAHSQLTNELLKQRGRPAVADETDWQFHTDSMLQEKLMFWGSDTIRKAILYLAEKDFIDIEAPAYLRELYKTGRTKWFKIKIASIQAWIVENYPLIDMQAQEIDTVNSKIRKKYKTENGDYNEAAERLFLFRQRMHKEPELAPDRQRLGKIIWHLKNGRDEIDCATAILGNTESPWHRGENPQTESSSRKVTYHQIKHIFGDSTDRADKLDYMIMLAGNAGWTRAKVIERYQTVLGINISNLSSLEQHAAALTPERTLEIEQLYREIAKRIVTMLITERRALPDIIKDFYDHADEYGFTLIDISDPDRLAAEIVDCLSENEIVTEDRKQRVTKFSHTFIEQLKGSK